MYAIFVEVNVPDDSVIDTARVELPKIAVPMAQANGAKAGYWLAPQGGRGVSVVVFDSEEKAREAAADMKPGEPAGTIPGVTFKTVEVREVLASL